MELKIITLNCFDSPLSLNRAVRIKVLIFEILKLKPDVICLQEITSSKTASNISEVFKKKGYNVFYNADLIFNRGGLFVASLIPVDKAKFIHFKNQGTYSSLQIADRLLGKGYQRIILSVNKNKLVLFNCHLAKVYNENSEGQKEALKDQFNQLVESLRIEKEKLILTGDFNFSPQNSLYADLLKKTKLIDPLWESSSITFSKSNTNRQGLYKNGTDLKIDYTFISEFFEVKNQKIIFDKLSQIDNKKAHLSDHYGLLTLLEV